MANKGLHSLTSSVRIGTGTRERQAVDITGGMRAILVCRQAGSRPTGGVGGSQVRARLQARKPTLERLGGSQDGGQHRQAQPLQQLPAPFCQPAQRRARGSGDLGSGGGGLLALPLLLSSQLLLRSTQQERVGWQKGMSEALPCPEAQRRSVRERGLSVQLLKHRAHSRALPAGGACRSVGTLHARVCVHVYMATSQGRGHRHSQRAHHVVQDGGAAGQRGCGGCLLSLPLRGEHPLGLGVGARDGGALQGVERLQGGAGSQEERVSCLAQQLAGLLLRKAARQRFPGSQLHLVSWQCPTAQVPRMRRPACQPHPAAGLVG